MVGPIAKVLGMVVTQTTSPFTAGICQTILPQNFKISYMEHYERKTDTLEHLGVYRVWMEFEAAEGGIMCQAFQLKEE